MSSGWTRWVHWVLLGLAGSGWAASGPSLGPTPSHCRALPTLCSAPAPVETRCPTGNGRAEGFAESAQGGWQSRALGTPVLSIPARLSACSLCREAALYGNLILKKGVLARDALFQAC